MAVLGGEAQLPCSLWPPQNVENMQITWTRSLPSQVVHQYKDGRDKPEEVMPEYFGRTELVRYAMYNGIVTLKIYNVRSSDRGKYRCAFQHGSDYSDTMTELRVEGTDPQLSPPHSTRVSLFWDGLLPLIQFPGKYKVIGQREMGRWSLRLLTPLKHILLLEAA